MYFYTQSFVHAYVLARSYPELSIRVTEANMHLTESFSFAMLELGLYMLKLIWSITI